MWSASRPPSPRPSHLRRKLSPIMLPLAFCGLGLMLLTGFIALFVRGDKACLRLGAAGVIAGAILCAIPTAQVLFTGDELALTLPWQVPFGSFHVVLDGLSALFLLPTLLLSAVAAVYGCGYMAGHGGGGGLRLGYAVLCYNFLAASMVMVLIARDGVLFLVAWELMSLSSYFLVTYDDEHESVRQAGWIYLVATHIGTAFLLAFFVLLGQGGGRMDFSYPALAGLSSGTALFLLALVGFGTKAGVMPLHVWLPEAHPAAPSHVSALMSGAMIKMGVYGIVRTLQILPQLESWWGWLLVGVGAVSGVLGILFSLAQHDFKRALAYSSIENVGVIMIGLGLGVVGVADHCPALAVLGFAGALWHMVNHALFKGLLFLGAGAAAKAAGTRYMDLLGGLAKTMPRTAATFIVGALAICAIPPFNGFIGEFLLYFGSFGAVAEGGPRLAGPAVVALVALASIGGLALVAFTKMVGIVFLGEPRSAQAAGAKEPGMEMLGAMWTLAGLCVVIGLSAPLLLPVFAQAGADLAGMPLADVAGPVGAAYSALGSVVLASAALLVLTLVLGVWRRRLLRGRTVTEQPTWGCGYAAATARVQYTASSFSQPIVDLFQGVLVSRLRRAKVKELFPTTAGFKSNTTDVSNEYLYRPIFMWIDRFINKMRWVQYGVVQLYVLYIALTLIILLLWKLR